jgi:hypothetical protein
LKKTVMSEIEMSNAKPISNSLRTIVLGVAILSLLGGGYAVWRYFDTPRLEKYSTLIQQIGSHQIPIDKDGRVDLSKAFPGLTPKDTAFVTWRDDGSFAALFPVYYGEGAQIAGLVYTSRPLQDGDTHLRDSPIQIAQQLIEVGTYQNLILDKQINPNWYHVSFHLGH